MTQTADRFFAWFDATEKEALESPEGKKLVAAGYAVMHTGGGCLSWHRKTTTNLDVYIGQDSGLGIGGPANEWVAEAVDDEGGVVEWLQFTDLTLDECIKRMAVIDAMPDKLPKPGTRVRFISTWEIFHLDVLIEKGETGTVVPDTDGDFAIKMDRHIPNIEEWENDIFLAPRDFAEDNNVTESGWVLSHIEPIEA